MTQTNEVTPQGDTLNANKVQTDAELATNTPPTDSVETSTAALKNELEREKARAATAQQEQDRLRKELRAIKQREAQPNVEANNSETTTSTSSQRSVASEGIELEKGLYKMLLDNPDYKKIVENDPTVKFAFEKNPLLLIDDPIDSADALYQFKNFFDRKVLDVKTKELESQVNKPDELTNASAPANTGQTTAPSAEVLAQLKPDELNKLLEQTTNDWANKKK